MNVHTEHDARAALPPAAFGRLAEVALAPGALAIADLHLDAARADSVARFTGFLAAIRGAPALLVLGDLFDVWVGPAEERLPGARLVLEALAAFARDGASVHVVPGNRDFLLDAGFERASGARLHPEGFVALAGGARVLCVHGDTLCTRDAGYLRLRRVLRSAPVRALGPRLPLWLSSAIARRMRRASVSVIAKKLPDEKSLQRAAAELLARHHSASTVLCGHAHAFRDEPLASGARWIVLDAFGGARDVACFGAEGIGGFRASGGG